MNRLLKILWIHNYPIGANPASGIFMHRMKDWVRSEEFDVHLHYLPTRNPFKLVQAVLVLWKIRSSYDLIHIQSGSLLSLSAILLIKRPIISLRGSDWYRIEGGPITVRVQSLLATLFTRFVVRKSRHIICMSERMRSELLSFDGTLSVSVLPDGIDMNEFKPTDRKIARAVLGHDNDDSAWILFSSAKQKNTLKRRKLAIQAFEIAKSRNKEMTFIELSSIDPDRVVTYLNASNLVLLTSIHEGWPNIVKEGLACSIPFVSTDVSDLAAVARELPNCFVSQETPTAIADAIQLSLNGTPSSKLREYAARFDSGRAASQLQTLYRRLQIET